MFKWATAARRGAISVDATRPRDSVAASIVSMLSDVRQRVRARVHEVNETTAREVLAAARHVDAIVERARDYIRVNQDALSVLTAENRSGVAKLISDQSELLRSYAKEMADRAATQDEHVRRAAQHAATIADLASGIEQLAGDARMLAINARIESARSSGGRGGFDVLAAEMRRLSDAVAASNDRVRELAGLLASDLTAITEHSRELRADTHTFSVEAVSRIEETERSVKELRERLTDASRAGEAGMQCILQCSQDALSHLQFQDVVAQDLRYFDSWVRDTQVRVAERIGASSDELAAIAPPDYVTEGGGERVSNIAASGDVTLF